MGFFNGKEALLDWRNVHRLLKLINKTVAAVLLILKPQRTEWFFDAVNCKRVRAKARASALLNTRMLE